MHLCMSHDLHDTTTSPISASSSQSLKFVTNIFIITGNIGGDNAKPLSNPPMPRLRSDTTTAFLGFHILISVHSGNYMKSFNQPHICMAKFIDKFRQKTNQLLWKQCWLLAPEGNLANNDNGPSIAPCKTPGLFMQIEKPY